MATRVRSLVPMALVRSVPASIAFYRLLGFEVENTFTPPDREEPTWASLGSGPAQLMVALASGPAVVSREAVLFYVYCEDVGVMRDQLVGHGIPAGPIEAPFYAPRGEFRVEDPDGYTIMVTHTGSADLKDGVHDFERLSLRTRRLLLRSLREADAPELFAIFSDPKVMRFWSTPAWPSIERAHEIIAGDLVAARSGERLRLGIERLDDGALIGTCSLFDLAETSRRAELGYALAHGAWGRGYMHEALVALLDYGFSRLGLNRVEADIDPRNEPSARSLENLGFRKEGLLRERWIVNGEVSDSALYGLLLADWQSKG